MGRYLNIYMISHVDDTSFLGVYAQLCVVGTKSLVSTLSERLAALQFILSDDTARPAALFSFLLKTKKISFQGLSPSFCKVFFFFFNVEGEIRRFQTLTQM